MLWLSITFEKNNYYIKIILFIIKTNILSSIIFPSSFSSFEFRGKPQVLVMCGCCVNKHIFLSQHLCVNVVVIKKGLKWMYGVIGR